MTKHAVRRFQLSHRLYPASGSVGDRTSATLLAAVARAGDRPVAPPRPPAPRHATVPAIAGPGGRDPIPGFSIGRDDMGVDASARVGTAIYAPVASRLVQVLRGWYAGQPLLLFKFLSPPAGVLSDFWYVAEQVAPVTTAIGTTFRAGEPVGTYASSGTGIEIGWGSPTSNARTLADVTDPGASSPSGKTVWGESFKKFFGIP